MPTKPKSDVSFSLKAYISKKAALASFITFMLIALSAVFIYNVWMPQRNQEQFGTLSQAYLQQQLDKIDALLVSKQDLLTVLSSSPELVAVLQSPEPDLRQLELEQLQQHYLASLDGLVDIKVIPLNELGIGAVDTSVYQLNNIELDMISAASKPERKQSIPEAYLKDKKWLLSFAQASQINGEVIGALLLSFNLDELDKLLMSQQEMLNIDLRSHPQHQSSMLKFGKIGAYAKSGSGKITDWQLKVSPSEKMMSHYQLDMNPLWICLALVAFTLGLVVFVLLKEIYNRLSQQVDQAKTDLAQSISNERAPKPNLHWYELQQLCQIAITEAEQARAKLIRNGAKAQASSVDDDILEIASLDEIADTLELDDSFVTESLDVPAVNPTIFRAYDIRGHADQDLYPEVSEQIGKAVASYAIDSGQTSLIVACDGRLSSESIKQSLLAGIQSTGCHVIDIGLQPTPMLYFACHELTSQSGIMITGSHNPKDDNGFKIVINQQALTGSEIQQIQQRIELQDFHQGTGEYQESTIEQAYVENIINDVAIAQPLKVVVDCGNGASSNIAPRLLEELGCEIVPLFCEVDGNFPNHHPDPSKAENLQSLIQAVSSEGADLGIAFDGDGDRLGVVSASGQIIETDRLLMLLAQDVVSRNPGTDVIFDVKCTRQLNNLISSYGGRPIMWKSGHSLIKEKMRETGALLGGEYSGHIFFKERWFGFDDGLYSACRLIEILSTTDSDLDNQLAQFPESFTTPELHIDISEADKFTILDKLKASTAFGEARLNDLDGLRADFSDGWGLVRASNTTAKLTLRFEADTDEALSRIQALFKQEISQLDSSLVIPF